ncbi:MAG: rod shape-determining protein MreD [bacterium]|nr:rod shape-determining protein MreD [bacterium]
MRTFFLILMVVLLSLIQISGLNNSLFAITPNFVLAGLVVLAMLIDFNQLIWLAFTGGLILDFNSSVDFGLNTVFLILMILVIRLIIKTSEISTKLIYSLIIVGIATVFYNLVIFTTIIRSSAIINPLNLGFRLAVELVCNLVLTALIYWLVEFSLAKIEEFNKTRKLKLS